MILTDLNILNLFESLGVEDIHIVRSATDDVYVQSKRILRPLDPHDHLYINRSWGTYQSFARAMMAYIKDDTL
jgi:hypothetical protein